MAESDAVRTRARAEFLATLVDAGHLIPLGVPGVYARGGVFESIVDCLERYVTREGAHLQAEVVRFPPLFSRSDYSRTDHVETMPQLLGSVHSFRGGQAEFQELTETFRQGRDWASGLTPTDVMLVPAACYPLYPRCSGTLPVGGRTVDLLTFVFRHEPSDDPARMQSFRQREYVRLGTPDEALAHRDDWLRRAHDMLKLMGLDVSCVAANDPFFGAGGRLMKATQREQNLKFELVVPITSVESPTAVASSNCHLDHFGRAFGIRTADGETAHTACVGFGLERITLALIRTHGIDPESWPEPVKQVLEWH